MEPMKSTPKTWGAFSLVELLLVIAMLGILLVLVIPAITSISSNFQVTRQGQIVADNLVLARQMATSRNRDFELRFFETPGSEPRWSFQIMEVGTGKSASRKYVFPDPVIINKALSPLVTGATSTGTTNGATWYAIRFRSNGRIAASLDNSNNYLTIQLRSAETNAPANHSTLQINPVTGRIASYRP